MSSLIIRNRGGVMTWACMAVCGTGSVNFIDDITHDNGEWNERSRMNSDYLYILSASLERNFIKQQNNNSKHIDSKTKGLHL